jgi:hypothetical protein
MIEMIWTMSAMQQMVLLEKYEQTWSVAIRPQDFIERRMML